MNGILQVTDKAIAQLNLALAEVDAQRETGIRVGIKGGGCSGYQYVLDIDEQKEHDFVQDEGGVKIFIDPMSAPYIKGTTLDYLTTLQASGFNFTNPNAVKTCGCGMSFSA